MSREPVLGATAFRFPQTVPERCDPPGRFAQDDQPVGLSTVHAKLLICSPLISRTTEGCGPSWPSRQMVRVRGGWRG